jgi:hypothetical protein
MSDVIDTPDPLHYESNRAYMAAGGNLILSLSSP